MHSGIIYFYLGKLQYSRLQSQCFRLGNVPLLEPPSEEFQEIPFYEWAGAPVYPDFEFQEVRTKGGKTKTRLVLDLSPYTVSDLKRLETDQWCFLFNE